MATSDDIRNNVKSWEESQERKKLTQTMRSLTSAISEQAKISNKNLSVLNRAPAVNAFASSSTSKSGAMGLDLAKEMQSLNQSTAGYSKKVNESTKMLADQIEKSQKDMSQALDGEISKLINASKDSSKQMKENIEMMDRSFLDGSDKIARAADDMTEVMVQQEKLSRRLWDRISQGLKVAAPGMLGAGAYYGAKAIRTAYWDAPTAIASAPVKAGMAGYRKVKNVTGMQDAMNRGEDTWRQERGDFKQDLGNQLMTALSGGIVGKQASDMVWSLLSKGDNGGGGGGGGKKRGVGFSKEGAEGMFGNIGESLGKMFDRFTSKSEGGEGKAFNMAPSEEMIEQFETLGDRIEGVMDPSSPYHKNRGPGAKANPLLEEIQHMNEMRYVELTGGKRQVPKGRDAKFYRRQLESGKPEGQARSIADAIGEQFKGTMESYSKTLTGGLGLKTIVGYALPIFGAGYRAELPNKNMPVFHRLAAIGELTYVAIRFMSKEMNDLLMQIGEFVRVGFGLEGRMKAPQGRSIAEILGGLIKGKTSKMVEQGKFGEAAKKYYEKHLSEEKKFMPGGKSLGLQQVELLKDIKLALVPKKGKKSYAMARGNAQEITSDQDARLHRGETVGTSRSMREAVADGYATFYDKLSRNKYGKRVTDAVSQAKEGAQQGQQGKTGILGRIVGGVGGALKGAAAGLGILDFFKKIKTYLAGMYYSLTGDDPNNPKEKPAGENLGLMGTLSSIATSLKTFFVGSEELGKGGIIGVLVNTMKMIKDNFIEHKGKEGGFFGAIKGMMTEFAEKFQDTMLGKASTTWGTVIQKLLPEWLRKGIVSFTSSFQEKVIGPILDAFAKVEGTLMGGIKSMQDFVTDKKGIYKVFEYIKQAITHMVVKPIKALGSGLWEAANAIMDASIYTKMNLQVGALNAIQHASKKYLTTPFFEIASWFLEQMKTLVALPLKAFEAMSTGAISGWDSPKKKNFKDPSTLTKMGGALTGIVKEPIRQAGSYLQTQKETGKNAFGGIAALIKEGNLSSELKENLSTISSAVQSDLGNTKEGFGLAYSAIKSGAPGTIPVRDYAHVSGPGMYQQKTPKEAHMPIPEGRENILLDMDDKLQQIVDLLGGMGSMKGARMKMGLLGKVAEIPGAFLGGMTRLIFGKKTDAGRQGGVVGLITGAVGGIGNAIGGGFSALAKALSATAGGIAKGAGAAAHGITGAIGGVGRGFGKVMKGAGAAIGQVLGLPFKALGALKNLLMMPVQLAKAGIKKVIGKVKDITQGEIVGIGPNGEELRTKYGWQATYMLLKQMMDEQWEIGTKTFMLHKTQYQDGDISKYKIMARGRRKADGGTKGLFGELKDIIGSIGGAISGIGGTLAAGVGSLLGYFGLTKAAGYMKGLAGKSGAKIAAGAGGAIATTAGGIAAKGAGAATKTAGGLGEVAAKAGGKVVAKSAGKGILKSIVKKIPVIGLLAGIGFGLSRLLDGDITGAAAEVASGVASLVPGVGTGVSVMIDAGLIAKDIKDSKEIDKKLKEAEKKGKLPKSPAETASGMKFTGKHKEIMDDHNARIGRLRSEGFGEIGGPTPSGGLVSSLLKSVYGIGASGDVTVPETTGGTMQRKGKKLTGVKGQVTRPTGSKVITSLYGNRPNSKGYSNPHGGIDLRAPMGSPIYAALGGTVRQDGHGSAYGTVTIDHGGGLETRYLHMIKSHVSNGSYVQAGQVIGEAGGKGPKGDKQYGSHLHFEVMKDGVKYDPQTFLSGQGIELALKKDINRMAGPDIREVGDGPVFGGSKEGLAGLLYDNSAGPAKSAVSGLESAMSAMLGKQDQAIQVAVNSAQTITNSQSSNAQVVAEAVGKGGGSNKSVDSVADDIFWADFKGVA